MTFDSTVTLGALLNVGAVVVGFVLFIAALRGRLDMVDQSVEAIQDTIKAIQKKLDDVVAQDKRIAIVEERQSTTSKLLTNMADDIHDLRRGDGYIRNHKTRNQTIDGEYP